MAFRDTFELLRQLGANVIRVDVDDRDFRRYGSVEVGADRRHELFREHTRLDEEGFTEVRRGYFVREAAPEIFQVLHHHTGKNSTYVTWGVSLAFVPYEFGAQVRFHRTLKSARMDLSNQDPGKGACYLHDEPPWVRDMQAMWSRSKPQVRRFWTTGSSVEGVIQLADEMLSIRPDKFGWTPVWRSSPVPGLCGRSRTHVWARNERPGRRSTSGRRVGAMSRSRAPTKR